MGKDLDYSRVGAAVVAKVFGVTTRTVREWESSGCPAVRPEGGRLVFFSLPAVIEWRIARAEDAAVKRSARAGSPSGLRSSSPDPDDAPSAAGDREWQRTLAEAGVAPAELDYDPLDPTERPDRDDPWIEKGGSSPYQELGRKRAAGLARLKLEEAKGRLLDIDLVRRLVDRLATGTRGLLEGLSTELCPECRIRFDRQVETGLRRVAEETSGALGLTPELPAPSPAEPEGEPLEPAPNPGGETDISNSNEEIKP